METVLDTYQQVVHSNATITASGSSVVAMNFGHKEVTLVVNVTAAPTGTTPSITFTVQEVDPGNGTTVIGSAKSGSALTGIATQTITLPVMVGGDIVVTWTVTGTTPSFTGVYATLVNKGPSPAIYDQAGNGPVAVKAASTAVAAADPSLAVGLSPNSPLPTGANTIGVVNQGTAATVANSWNVEITDGTHGPVAVKAASTAAAATDPSLVVALSPNSPTPGVADLTATGALGALNAAVTLTTAGLKTVGFQLAAGTLIGTIVPEVSFDGGTTWNATFFDQNNKVSSIVFASANTAQAGTLVGEGGSGQVRVRVSAFTSGTANITLRASEIDDPSDIYGGLVGAAVQPPTAAQVAGWDGTTYRVPTVKAGSTALAATDQPLAVALHPSSPLPAGTNIIGALSANQSVNVAQVGGAATATAASGVQKVGVVGNAGATLDATLAAGTAPTDGLGVLIQYNTTQPAPTAAQTLSLQSDQAGNLLTFPGAQTKAGAAWTSATAINTLQFPTGTATVGAALGGGAVLVQLDQTTTLTGGAVTFQGTYDGANWVTIPTAQVVNPQTFAQLTNPYTFVATTNQPFLILLQGFQQVRLNLTTVITGTGSVTPNWTLLLQSPLGASNTVQGLAAAGIAPIGNPLPLGVVAPSGNMENVVGGSDGEVGVALMGNDSSVHSNSTITTSGSTTITKSFYGVQQINLIVNVKNAPTGTTPTITYTVQELDPGDGATTMGNSSSTTTISGTGVFTAGLQTSTSSAIKVSWTVTGTTPSFTGVYATVVSKATPATQTTSTTSTTSTPGTSPGYITTSAKTNVALQASTYNEQSANFTGSVKSASASDASAGTGAQTITIYWMNATGTTTGTETATMNGTTAVNLVTTTKCFIEKIVTATVGSTGSNVGAITLFSAAAGGGTAVALMNATDNQTFLGHHYVVSGKTSHVTDMTGITNSSNQSTFTLTAVSIPVAGLPVLQVSDWVNGSQTFQIQRTYGQQILVVGPARMQMFVAPGATASILSHGTFDYFDQ